jgi:hypothetical protein
MAAMQATQTRPIVMGNMQKQEQSPNQVDIEAQSRHSSSATEAPALTAVVNSPEGARPVVLDWDSPDDPDNPQLWPQWKKVFNVAVPAIFAFIL